MVPAAAFVQKRFGKRFILIDPPRRHSEDLTAIADLPLHSRRHYFAQCLLPDPVVLTTRKGRERRIHCPPSWYATSVTAATETPGPDADGVIHCLSCGQPVPAAGVPG
jgi:hypothetical protein